MVTRDFSLAGQEPRVAPERRLKIPIFVTSVIALIVTSLAVVRCHSPSQGAKHTIDIAPTEPIMSLAYAMSTNQEWTPHFLVDYPLAVCNDGSPAAYYYRAGDAGSRNWLVFLEGSGWCWDQASCSRPWHKDVGTSAHFPRSPEAVEKWAHSLEGIMDGSGKSPTASMHTAFVRTCGNDAFMGNRGPLVPGGKPGIGWHFRGKAIIDAVFTDLRMRYGVGAHHHHVLYGGCSSGARGALITLDYVAKNFAGNGTVVGLLDSPLWVPIDPLVKTYAPFEEQTQRFVEFTNSSILIDGHCATAYSKASSNQWQCLMGAYRLPFVQTPYFLTHSQYDLFSVSSNTFGYYTPFTPFNDHQKDYADSYRRMLVKYLPHPTEASGKLVFSSACYTHCTITSHTFYKIQADGHRLLGTLQHWLTSPSIEAATGSFIEKCEGFNCGRPKKSSVSDEGVDG